MTVIRWTPEEDAILRLRWPNETPEAIGAAINRTANGVKKRSRKLGLTPHQSGRKFGTPLSEESLKQWRENRFHAKQVKEIRGRAIRRDPFIAILFGACEAIKATALPSRIFRQSMEVNDELEAA